MKRREFLGKSAALGVLAAIPASGISSVLPPNDPNDPKRAGTAEAVRNPLSPPAKGKIPVGFVISDGAVMIDFAGPWEVFQDVMISSRGTDMDDQMPFQLYTVAETSKAVAASGGLKIVPDYTFADAPMPKVVVIPAQGGESKAMLDWIRKTTTNTDVTMSVCTGAFILANTGLLKGKAATTHHWSYKKFAMDYPDIELKRGARFVEAGNLATSGGLSSGIDLALRVVERYFGRKVAADTAYGMEYQGNGWMDPASNATYLKAAVSSDEQPRCAVCSMEVNRATARQSTYKGKTYYFCSDAHKSTFDAAPEKWL
jgi:transcriptional regulator GlxA family with amidase domain